MHEFGLQHPSPNSFKLNWVTFLLTVAWAEALPVVSGLSKSTISKKISSFQWLHKRERGFRFHNCWCSVPSHLSWVSQPQPTLNAEITVPWNRFKNVPFSRSNNRKAYFQFYFVGLFSRFRVKMEKCLRRGRLSESQKTQTDWTAQRCLSF